MWQEDPRPPSVPWPAALHKTKKRRTGRSGGSKDKRMFGRTFRSPDLPSNPLLSSRAPVWNETHRFVHERVHPLNPRSPFGVLVDGDCALVEHHGALGDDRLRIGGVAGQLE